MTDIQATPLPEQKSDLSLANQINTFLPEFRELVINHRVQGFLHGHELYAANYAVHLLETACARLMLRGQS